MEKFKSGFVSIIGRTNVGKSTLLNSLIGEKIAITTHKPQTTRHNIKGIVNRENSQIVFIDTPGIHKPKSKLGDQMINVAFETISDVDVILFVIDATSKGVGKGDKIILERLKEKNKNVILLINKIDLVQKTTLLSLIDEYRKEYDFKAVIPISAIKGKEKEKILQEIEKLLPYGPAYYNIEEFTDQTEKTLVSEIIREQSLKLLNEEVPHGIYVEVDKMKNRQTKKKEPIYDIEVTIFCLRESHKGIIIGKNGTMLKRIGTSSRIQMERLLGCRVNLKIWVKVKEDWQDKENIIKNI